MLGHRLGSDGTRWDWRFLFPPSFGGDGDTVSSTHTDVTWQSLCGRLMLMLLHTPATEPPSSPSSDVPASLKETLGIFPENFVAVSVKVAIVHGYV